MSHLTMFSKSLKTLEFDKIRVLLADCAATEGAKEEAMLLTPETEIIRIKRLQAETSAAKYLITKKTVPSFGAVKDIGDSTERAAKKAILTPRELLDIANVLRVSRGLIDYIDNDPADETVIDVIFHRLTANRFLEEKIYKTLPVEDMVADEASPALADIRRKIRNAQVSIRETLQRYTTGTYSKYLQENIVTVRNGRFVVPVKSEFKNEFKGLVHDTSATGQTFFIEPYAVVEANNELKELQTKEAREVERILAALSADCALYGETLRLNYFNITHLAFIFAKAEFSFRYSAIEPEINEDRYIYFEKARHPLIDQSKVVPITVGLGKEYDTLVITGPNTGGKTVSLKTMGLLSIMAQSGLHLPCEKASTCVFSDILADIGDEQSIEQSLSTFSSHMVNILEILSNVSNESLVLFDELCAGTDPVEGAALAISILEEVRSYHALCAATTHYSELKEYAVNKERVTNAGCEFDIETLNPTYRLVIGTPGRSNAFAISEKLGMSKSLINRAEKYVSTENRRVEDVIAKLDAQRVELEKLKEDLIEKQKDFESYEREKRKYIEELSERTHRDNQNLRDQAIRMMESAKASSNFIFDKLDKLQKQKDSERTRQDLEKAREEIRNNIKNTEGTYISSNKKHIEKNVSSKPFKTGDEVILINYNKKAVITKGPNPDGSVTVKAGIVTLNTDVSNLAHLEPDKKETKQNKGSIGKTLANKPFKSEVDLRGMTGDEAWFVIDKYIDDAMIAHFYTVTLIHGKGTGALRNAIWSMLKKDKRIENFRPGNFGEGDYGVTVIEIKK